MLRAPKRRWPPMLIQVGDTECLLGDSERMTESVRAAGGHCELQVWPGQVHVFPAFYPVLPEGRAAIRYVGDFLRERRGRHRGSVNTARGEPPPPGWLSRLRIGRIRPVPRVRGREGTYATCRAQALADASVLATGVLESAGPVMVWLIVLGFVFTECAFIVGLFLPGDSLLFAAGVVLAQHDLEASAWALSIAATITAVVGNMLGYYIGHKTGNALIARRGGRVLNFENLARARDFLDRRGFWAIVLARWLPWIRTLAPLIAGAAKMDRRRFLLATSLGGLAWVPTLVLVGFYAAGSDRGSPVAQGRRAVGEHRVLRRGHGVGRAALPAGDAPAAGDGVGDGERAQRRLTGLKSD